MFRRTTLFVLFVGVLIVATALPAVAAKGGKGGGNSPQKDNAYIVLNEPSPVYGDTVTFSIYQTATDRPFVRLQCFKAGALVYEGTVGMFQDWYDEWGEPDFVLESLAWNGGDGNCTATLQYMNSKWRWINLATTDFDVIDW